MKATFNPKKKHYIRLFDKTMALGCHGNSDVEHENCNSIPFLQHKSALKRCHFDAHFVFTAKPGSCSREVRTMRPGAVHHFVEPSSVDHGVGFKVKLLS